MLCSDAADAGVLRSATTAGASNPLAGTPQPTGGSPRVDGPPGSHDRLTGAPKLAGERGRAHELDDRLEVDGVVVRSDEGDPLAHAGSNAPRDPSEPRRASHVQRLGGGQQRDREDALRQFDLLGET